MTKRRLHKEPRRFWTPAEDAVLRDRYPYELAEDLVPALPGRTKTTIYQRAQKLGIRKSPEFMSSPIARRLDGKIGAATRFKAGHVPFNKGKPFHAGGRSALTRFGKGNKPHTWVPIGTRVKDCYGYWKEKVADPNKWQFVHRMVWEAAHGPIPRGAAITFRDGNKDHTALENLQLLTRQELMRRNSYHNYPQPIPKLIQLRGALVRKINRETATT